MSHKKSAEKTGRPISGIACSVINCVYNGGELRCEASGIEVSSCDPIQQCSVTCATFQPKAGR